MKRITVLFFFQVFFLSPLCFAQTLTIAGVKGSVQYKDAADKPWQQAKPSIRLGKNAELMTASNAECTLSFEQERKNVITIKADSVIKLENIIPVNSQ